MLKLIASVALLMSSSAMASKFYVLNYNNVKMISSQGQDTLKLKQKLKATYPGIQLQKMELMSVMMVGKTKHGQGWAELRVGQSYSPNQTVKGKPFKFQSGADKSYDRILFENPKTNSQGPWQIKLQGQFRVKHVVVELSKKIVQKNLQLVYNIHRNTMAGAPNTLFLKNRLKNTYGINTQLYKIKGVTIVGKSQFGQGTVRLKVGTALSIPTKMAGNPVIFQTNGNFDTDYLANPKNNSNGVWQLKLKGNIKIKKVIVHLIKK